MNCIHCSCTSEWTVRYWNCRVLFNWPRSCV